MATYFHGNPEIQAASASAEGLQTLVLMNPSYVQFSDSSPSNNLLFLNPAGTAVGGISALSHLSHGPPTTSTQQFVGIPLDPNSHDLHGILPRLQYNLYNPMEQVSPARDTPRGQQGLSLSLSSQQQHPQPAPPPPGYGSQVSGDNMRISGGSVSPGSGVTNVVSGLQGMLLSSKFLKAAQEILDEVVNVNSNGIKSEFSAMRRIGAGLNSAKLAGETTVGDGSSCGDTSGKRSQELSTADRQEIHMKKAKLINMLDEVEQRYRQYDHQMQIVRSSFEQAAGSGSANTYTALALGTISKQFKCLKDAIVGQIKIANKSLGEEDSLGGKGEGSRLKYVDHHYRQQRALQQLGMIQHNAWRPQRGLPERSVSVLRAWLFEHFLHPYPKDSDKHMLAKQTGLTRGQVSNWFINARVRLWKPMVEEMYLEEMKENEKNSSESKAGRSELNDEASPGSFQKEKSSGTEKMLKPLEHSPNPQPNPSVSMSASSASPVGGNLRNHSGFTLIGASGLEGITQASPKKPRGTDLMHSPPGTLATINMDIKPGDGNSEQMTMKFGEDRESRDGFTFFGGPNNFIGGFGQYPIPEIGRFEAEQFAPRFSGNGVSLTLGLPNQDLISLSGPHQNFLPSQNIQLGRRLDLGEPNDFGSLNSPATHSTTAFESINNIQNRKRFAAQLLPDFVA